MTTRYIHTNIYCWNYMKRSYTKIYLALCLAICSGFSFADSDHQFSVNLSKNWVDYIQGDATSYNINATAYFNPVKKTTELPFARTAFYSRTSSVSASATKTNWDDLNSVVGRRILKNFDTKNYYISTFLAHRDLPIWGQLAYRYLDNTTWYFSDGSKSVSDTNSIKELALGVYLPDNLSINGLVSKLDDKTYGVGLSKLFSLNKFGFIETNLSFAITKIKSVEPVIKNNVVRNLYIAARTEKNRFIRLSYYPFPETRLSIAYQQIDYDQHDWKDSYSNASLQHYFNKVLNVTLSYTHKETYFFNYLGEYNDIGLSIGLEF